MRALPQSTFVFVTFSFVIRLVQLIYIDVFGPFDSIELGREIGIRNGGWFLFIISYMPLFLFLRKIEVCDYGLQLNSLDKLCLNVFHYIILLIIITCYIDLFLFREVPLLVGMDRLEFNKLSENSIHSMFRRISPLLSVGLGVSLYQEKIRTERYKSLPVLNISLLFFYFFLTGNRFSIFYTIATFFAFSRGFYPKMIISKSTNLTGYIRNSRLLLSIVVFLIIGAVGNNLYQSFTVIRGYEDVALVFFNRAILENVGVFQAVYDGGIDKLMIHQFLLFEAIDPNKSAAMQFMMQELSYTYNYINQIMDGQVFSGGFPEFFLYTLNYYSLIPIITISVILRLLLRIMSRVHVRKNIVLFLLGFQCIFPFMLFFTSGFIDFLYNPIYYFKLVFFILSYHVYIFYNSSDIQRGRHNNPLS